MLDQEIVHNVLEDKIGFTQVKEWVKSYCLCKAGERKTEQLKFLTNKETILTLLSQTNELKKVLEDEEAFPRHDYFDVEIFLNKLRLSGAFLESKEFHDLRAFLRTVSRIKQFIEVREREEMPSLKRLIEDVVIDFRLIRDIDKIITVEGNIRDDASFELYEIRKELQEESIRLRKETDRLLKAFIREGYTDADLLPTIRNGRTVIPVYAEHKRQVRGFIHDESATGQTAFIEPAQILEYNNNIKDLQHKESREVIRILIALSDEMREHLPELLQAYEFLGDIDLIRAKAKWSIACQAIQPTIIDHPVMEWKQARHPLLERSLKEQNKPLVPINFYLSEKDRILILSGPNAGGKSICLKTAGLLQYCLQTGLLVPVNNGSKFGLFSRILLDIGDQQSLENDLSTYSSHLKNLKHFIDVADDKSLVLIDEFGGGTEPRSGSAIAESVLKVLNNKKVLGVITTHFDNLKKLGSEEKGFINGAMLFNLDTLNPLFQLEWGKPGSSFALEIAQNIGLPSYVLEEARTLLGEGWQQYDKLLRDLEKQHAEVRSRRAMLAQLNKQSDALKKDLQTRLSELDLKRRVVLNEAKEKAKGILSNASGVLNELQLIKNSNQPVDKENLKVTKSSISGQLLELVPEEIVTHQEPLVPEKGPVEIGSYVKFRDQEAYGKVIAIKGKDIEILIGDLKSVVKSERLLKISKKDYERQVGKETKTYHTGASSVMLQRTQTFNPKLDLRGMRGEEAMSIFTHWIDDSLLLGFKEVVVVHGKGNGILRTLIREYLADIKQVKGVEDDHADRGGAGATVIKF
ncbi:MAG: Smr/MutS family protein [Cytophagaceae bacterium]|nr:Smr/MutS family protein [Cytophagaceae bacterium]